MGLRSHISQEDSQNLGKVLPFPKPQPRPEQILLRKRGYALVTDLFMVGIIKKMTILSLGYFLKAFFYQLHILDQIYLLNGMEPVNIFLTFPVMAGYFFISFSLGEGKTVGALLFKISVKNKKGEHPTFTQALLRSMGYVLSYLSAGILFALPMIRKDKRGLGDIFSKTHIQDDHQIAQPQEIPEEDQQKLAA